MAKAKPATKPASNRASKQELLLKDVSKALEFVEKAQEKLTKALDRLPKTKPIPLPAGTALQKHYGTSNLQDALRDFTMPEAVNGYELGLLPGCMDVLEMFEALLGGEGGFEI